MKNGSSPHLLSEREHRLVSAIAETVIPPGRIVSAGGSDTADRVERFLRGSDATIATGYRALLLAFEAASLLRRRRRFAALDPAARLAFLESLRHGTYATRFGLRTLLAVVKISHFDEPEVYRRIDCVYTATAAPEVRPGWWGQRVRAGAEVAGETLKCDVLVIGTGAGGAVVAKELAERGAAVIMLEEGRYFGRADFNRRPTEMHQRLYRDFSATTSVGNAPILIPVGRTVGGTTTINSGTCYRAPERVFRVWREKHGLPQFSSESMAPHYERVERIMGVGVAPREYLGGVARVVARGADAIGLHKHGPLRRNAPDCDGQGVCCYGCPTDAKRSTNVSYVPLALRAGAHLVTSARAQQILVEHGRAVGVEASVVGGHDGERLTVRARRVVVACGALMTPVFLGAQKGLANGSGQLGRNLSIHPAVGVAALFDEALRAHDGIPQSYAVEDNHDDGILPIGSSLPLEFAAGALPLVGRAFTEVCDEFERAAVFGVMIEDSSRGRVRRGVGGRPLITYVMNDEDVRRLQRGVEIVSRIYLAAGARRVLPIVAGFDELRGPSDVERFAAAKLHARDFEVTAYHPLGTARMGPDPRSSVVGPEHQCHEVPGLFIIDGSAVPSSLAVNPQLTIMALATRAADLMAERLA